MDALKRDPLITAFFYCARIVNGIFPAKISEILFYGPGITMGCSNVPGNFSISKLYKILHYFLYLLWHKKSNCFHLKHLKENKKINEAIKSTNFGKFYKNFKLSISKTRL